MNAQQVIDLVTDAGGWLFIGRDGSLGPVSFPDCIDAEEQGYLRRLVQQHEAEIIAILAQEHKPAPRTIEVEPACPCLFRPYPHVASSFDPATRRRHDRQREADLTAADGPGFKLYNFCRTEGCALWLDGSGHIQWQIDILQAADVEMAACLLELHRGAVAAAVRALGEVNKPAPTSQSVIGAS
jgi:hypothetical protein